MRPNAIMLVGSVLVIAGIMGFAIPAFTTRDSQEVARIGDLKIESSQDTFHTVPPLLSAGLLLVGVVLIGSSLYRKR
jgi:hypothetical protein